MRAMGGRALAPMFLHHLQYGVANLGRAYRAMPLKKIYLNTTKSLETAFLYETHPLDQQILRSLLVKHYVCK